MQQDQSALFRLGILERLVAQLQKQIEQYVPVKENELQLHIIRETVDQIKKEIGDIKQQLKSVDDKIIAQNIDTQRRAADLKEQQDKLVIRVLAYIVGTIVTLGGAVLVGYITHIIH